MRELSLRRMRRRKNAIDRGDIFSARSDRPPSVGMFCVEGMRFRTFWMKSMAAVAVGRCGEGREMGCRKSGCQYGLYKDVWTT